MPLDLKWVSGENHHAERDAYEGGLLVFMEPTPTPFDLRWYMFGIPIRVHPMFWLVSVIMGWNTIGLGIQYLGIWVACMFVSILIHELGHVCMGRMFGSSGHIILYSFGGLAVGSNRLPYRWQRIAVSFAGPLAGFVFLGFVLLFLFISNPDAFPAYIAMVKLNLGLTPDVNDLAMFRLIPSPYLWMTVSDLIWINLMWGLMNLLPVWPLDGGMITRELCEGAWIDTGLTRSLGISLVVAGLIGVHAALVHFGQQLVPIPFGGIYIAILFGVLAVQSYQLLQRAHAEQRYLDDHWDRPDD